MLYVRTFLNRSKGNNTHSNSSIKMNMTSMQISPRKGQMRNDIQPLLIDIITVLRVLHVNASVIIYFSPYHDPTAGVPKMLF